MFSLALPRVCFICLPLRTFVQIDPLLLYSHLVLYFPITYLIGMFLSFLQNGAFPSEKSDYHKSHVLESHFGKLTLTSFYISTTSLYLQHPNASCFSDNICQWMCCQSIPRRIFIHNDSINDVVNCE